MMFVSPIKWYKVHLSLESVPFLNKHSFPGTREEGAGEQWRVTLVVTVSNHSYSFPFSRLDAEH